MRRTPDLIETLVRNAAPVRRLRPPALGAALWMLLAAAILALLAVGRGFRADLAERLGDPVFALALAAALLTGVLAALAAFMMSLPDRPRGWLLLPAPALLVWIATIGYGCLTDWVALQPDGIRIGETLRCFSTLVLTSVPLSASMLVMLRHAARLRPTVVALLGGLAVAGISAAALSLFHDLDATLMVLLWNFGTAGLLLALAGCFGRPILSLVAARRAAPLADG